MAGKKSPNVSEDAVTSRREADFSVPHFSVPPSLALGFTERCGTERWPQRLSRMPVWVPRATESSNVTIAQDELSGNTYDRTNPVSHSATWPREICRNRIDTFLRFGLSLARWVGLRSIRRPFWFLPSARSGLPSPSCAETFFVARLPLPITFPTRFSPLRSPRDGVRPS